MIKRYLLTGVALAGLVVPGHLRAQAPVLASRIPQANATAAPLATPVQLSFSQPMSAQAASAAAIRVVSGWRGQLPGTYAGAGTPDLSFTPAQSLLGGEPVQVTLTKRVTSQAGVALSSPLAYQFRAAATGSGKFLDEDVPVGPYPTSIAVGDINNDGKPDFVVNGKNSGASLTVWLGDGAGGYLPPPAPIAASLSVGGVTRPHHIALADVNRDGFLDLLAVGGDIYGAYGVSLGDGTGRFAASGSDSGVSSELYGLALGDVNEDGLPDLVVGYARGGVALVRLGDGKGFFTKAADVPMGVVGVTALADVNGDKHLDIIGLASGTLIVRLGDGTGKFTNAPGAAVAVGAGAIELAVGDVNEDGKPDVLTSNRTANTVSVRLGDGAGGFGLPASPEVNVGTSPHLLALRDINRDGHLDFVTTLNAGTSTTISVRVGDGKGGFAGAPEPEVPVGITPDGLALTDLNQDGQPDLLVGNTGYPNGSARATYGTVSVRLGDGAGRFRVPSAPRVPMAGRVVKVGVGDLNNDRKLDLLTLYAGSVGTVAVRLGTGTGAFTPPAAPAPADIAGSSYYTGGLAVGDVNNDGNLDYVVDELRNSYYTYPITYLGNGQGSFTPMPLLAAANSFTGETSELQLTDLTGDGNLDLLVQASGVVLVFVGDGTGKFQTITTTLYLGAGDLKVGDVNGDGKPDLLLTKSSTVQVLLGDGAGGFGAPATITMPYAIGRLETADLNGDGKLDFVVCGGPTGINVVNFYLGTWLGDGTGSFKSGGPDLYLGDAYASGLALGDVNGDGKLDLTISSSINVYSEYVSRVALLLGDGLGGFAAPAVHPQLTAGVGTTSVRLADLDNDGDLDMVLSSSIERSLSIRLNGAYPGSVLPTRSTVASSNSSAAPLAVHPNPARGTVMVDNASVTEPLVLLDLLGREVYRQPAGPMLSLSGVAPGLYLLRSGTRTVRLAVD